MTRNGHGNGRMIGQMRMPGISWKVRNPGRKAPELSTFRLPAFSSREHEVNPDEQLLITVQDEDGNVLMSYYVSCDTVTFKRHRPAKGQRWSKP